MHGHVYVYIYIYIYISHNYLFDYLFISYFDLDYWVSSVEIIQMARAGDGMIVSPSQAFVHGPQVAARQSLETLNRFRV